MKNHREADSVGGVARGGQGRNRTKVSVIFISISSNDLISSLKLQAILHPTFQERTIAKLILLEGLPEEDKDI